MRSYFKVWRSSDFKTVVVDVPPGVELEDFEKLALMHVDRDNIPFLHQYITGIPFWIGYNEDLTIPLVGPMSGVTLINTLWNFQPYEDHPLN